MFFKLESGNVVNLANVAYYGSAYIFFTATEENGDYMGVAITQRDRERLNELLLGGASSSWGMVNEPRAVSDEI